MFIDYPWSSQFGTGYTNFLKESTWFLTRIAVNFPDHKNTPPRKLPVNQEIFDFVLRTNNQIESNCLLLLVTVAASEQQKLIDTNF